MATGQEVMIWKKELKEKHENQILLENYPRKLSFLDKGNLKQPMFDLDKYVTIQIIFSKLGENKCGCKRICLFA